ncbi:hypothetical protein NKG94_12215 [Micromonospora sp. M12]
MTAMSRARRVAVSLLAIGALTGAGAPPAQADRSPPTTSCRPCARIWSPRTTSTTRCPATRAGTRPGPLRHRDRAGQRWCRHAGAGPGLPRQP